MSPLNPTSSSGGGSSAPSRADQLATGLGYVAVTNDPVTMTGNLTVASQALRATAIGLNAGDVVTNICLIVATAASGTAPTLQKVAIADSSGNVLGKSNDLSASAIWTALGVAVAPLSTPFIVVTAGLYYLCYLRNGNYGTTNPAFLACASSGFNYPALSGKPLRLGLQAAQTDFGATVTLAATTQTTWFGVT